MNAKNPILKDVIKPGLVYKVLKSRGPFEVGDLVAFCNDRDLRVLGKNTFIQRTVWQRMTVPVRFYHEWYLGDLADIDVRRAYLVEKLKEGGYEL